MESPSRYFDALTMNIAGDMPKALNDTKFYGLTRFSKQSESPIATIWHS